MSLVEFIVLKYPFICSNQTNTMCGVLFEVYRGELFSYGFYTELAATPQYYFLSGDISPFSICSHNSGDSIQ